MAYASRDAILGYDDVVTEDVPVRQWGGMKVRLRSLSGTERDAFEASMVDQRGDSQKMNFANMRAKLLARCIVDENNERLFNDADVKALGKKNAAALDLLFSRARDLSGLSDKDVEDLTENLDSDQSDDSTSD